MTVSTRTMLLVAAGILLVWWIAHPTGIVGVQLLFGWMAFLSRIVGKMHIRWDGIAEFLIASALALLIAQLLLRWLAREVSRNLGREPVQWKWRWSAMLLAATLLLFTAGISMIGVVHQTAWMMRSTEPLMGMGMRKSWSDSESKNGLKQLGLATHNWLDSHSMPLPVNGSNPNWIVGVLPFTMYSIPPAGPERIFGDPAADKFYKSLVPELLNNQLANAPIRDARGYGLSHYAGNRNAFEPGVGHLHSGDFPLSHLLLLGEVNKDLTAWGSPELNRDPRNGMEAAGFGGPRSRNSVMFLMADGSVRMIDKEIDPAALEKMSVPQGKK